MKRKTKTKPHYFKIWWMVVNKTACLMDEYGTPRLFDNKEAAEGRTYLMKDSRAIKVRVTEIK